MSIWVCPTCHAKMNVKESLLGQLRACPSCKAESIVSESPPPMFPGQSIVTPPVVRQLPEKQQPEKSICLIALVMLYVLMAVMFIAGVASLLSGNKDVGFVLIAAGCGVLVQIVLISPIYAMVDDTRANRRLLEKIARSNER